MSDRAWVQKGSLEVKGDQKTLWNKRRCIICTALAILIIAIIAISASLFILYRGNPDMDTALPYLAKYGYMHQDDRYSLQKAVKDFQAFAGIQQTGELDSDTMEMMKKPRCGVRDILEDDEDMPRKKQEARLRERLTARPDSEDILKRSKRFVLQGSRWKVNELTYKVKKYPRRGKLSNKDVDDAIKEAFQVWEKATDLKFVQKTDADVHIEIIFERLAHGDGDPFDGLGGTLAHAFFPQFKGDVHFDDDESWTVKTARGTSLLMTAVHEFGHSLGLKHSRDRNSLMAPFYRNFDPKNPIVSLAEDDIRGIQAIYGEKTSSLPTPSFNSTDHLCDTGQIDTIVNMMDGGTYVFRGSQYWRLIDTRIAPGYPRLISEDWQGLPDSLDAAFTWTNNKTFFFKGSQFWRFSGFGNMDAGFPMNIKDVFGIPSNVEAAFVWPRNNNIYFFKDSKYWAYNPHSNPGLDPTSPQSISQWGGLPSNLEAALQHTNGKSYFFHSGHYYRLDDDTRAVDQITSQAFPRPTGFWWFGCEQNSVRLMEAESMKGDVFG